MSVGFFPPKIIFTKIGSRPDLAWGHSLLILAPHKEIDGYIFNLICKSGCVYLCVLLDQKLPNI